MPKMGGKSAAAHTYWPSKWTYFILAWHGKCDTMLYISDRLDSNSSYHNQAKDMMTSSNGTVFRVTGPLCGEFTGPGEFPTQSPVTRSFDVYFDLRLNKRLNKQSRGWWFETLSRPFWRHRNVLWSLESGRSYVKIITPLVSNDQTISQFCTRHDSCLTRLNTKNHGHINDWKQIWKRCALVWFELVAGSLTKCVTPLVTID